MALPFPRSILALPFLLATALPPVAALAADEPAPGDVAAVAGDDRVTFAELDALLLERHGTGERGKAFARYLGERALIAHLAREAGLAVTDEEVERRIRALDAEMRREGVEGGLAGELERSGIDREEFRSTLALAMLHERLTRRALGLPADAEVSGDQQQIWLDAQVTRLGLEVLPPPHESGVAARLGPVEVRASDLAGLLRERLDEREVREAMTQTLLLRRVERRLGALAPDVRSRIVRAEVERRRAEAEADPRFRNVSFDNLLAAQGLTAERLARDPAVQIAALSTHWLETTHGDESLRAAYAEERRFFDDHFGESVPVRVIFLSAAERPSEREPRSMSDAEATLRALSERIHDEHGFAALAERHSEDPETRVRGGELGHLVRASRALPRPILDEMFESRPGLFGPRRVGNGVVLLWLGNHRPAPPWDEMSRHVGRELRRRFLLECLPPSEIRTYLDEDEPAGPPTNAGSGRDEGR